jgi:hypothetical protein
MTNSIDYAVVNGLRLTGGSFSTRSSYAVMRRLSAGDPARQGDGPVGQGALVARGGVPERRLAAAQPQPLPRRTRQSGKFEGDRGPHGGRRTDRPLVRRNRQESARQLRSRRHPWLRPLVQKRRRSEVSIEGGEARVHNLWIAIDPGSVVNTAIMKAQVESAALGLSSILFELVVYEAGVRQAKITTPIQSCAAITCRRCMSA